MRANSMLRRAATLFRWGNTTDPKIDCVQFNFRHPAEGWRRHEASLHQSRDQRHDGRHRNLPRTIGHLGIDQDLYSDGVIAHDNPVANYVRWLPSCLFERFQKVSCKRCTVPCAGRTEDIHLLSGKWTKRSDKGRFLVRFKASGNVLGLKAFNLFIGFEKLLLQLLAWLTFLLFTMKLTAMIVRRH